MDSRIIGIVDKRQKRKLLSRMVSATEFCKIPGFEWLNWFAEWITEFPWRMTFVENPYPKILESFSKLWECQFGKWQHGDKKRSTHNTLGMAYAWWITHIQNIRKFDLSDSPDLYGEIKHDNGNYYSLWGDIGICTPCAFLTAMKTMQAGDLWVSVLSYETQVILEPCFDFATVLHSDFGEQVQKNNSQYIEENIEIGTQLQLL